MRLTIHHIGARGGIPLPRVLQQFKDEIALVGYEADLENPLQKGSTTVLPFAISDRSDDCEFFVNNSENTSSLRERNQRYDSCLTKIINGWQTFKDSHSTRKVLTLKTTTIDEVSKDFPPPDLLSIDAQGCALEVLKGAERTLLETTVAVLAETEFHPIYKDQKLFGDLSAWLESRGFVFMNFPHIRRWGWKANDHRITSKNWNAASEALFLSSPETISHSAQTDAVRLQRLHKLALIALTYGHVDVAIDCFNVINRLSEGEKGKGKTAIYGFLDELQQALADKRRHAPIRGAVFFLRRIKACLRNLRYDCRIALTSNTSFENALLKGGFEELVWNLKEIRLGIKRE